MNAILRNLQYYCCYYYFKIWFLSNYWMVSLQWCKLYLTLPSTFMLTYPSCTKIRSVNYYGKRFGCHVKINRLLSGKILLQLLCRLVGDSTSFWPREDFCSCRHAAGNRCHDRLQVSVCQRRSACHLCMVHKVQEKVRTHKCCRSSQSFWTQTTWAQEIFLFGKKK